MINLQPIFDKVAAHLKTQNRQATADDGNNCRYLNDEGLRCAVGCLIDKAHYDPEFEGQCPDWVKSTAADKPEVSLNIFNAVVKSQQLTLDNDADRASLGLLLRKLQSIHDNYKVEEWPFALDRLATELNLSYAR